MIQGTDNIGFSAKGWDTGVFRRFRFKPSKTIRYIKSEVILPVGPNNARQSWVLSNTGTKLQQKGHPYIYIGCTRDVDVDAGFMYGETYNDWAPFMWLKMNGLPQGQPYTGPRLQGGSSFVSLELLSVRKGKRLDQNGNVILVNNQPKIVDVTPVSCRYEGFVKNTGAPWSHTYVYEMEDSVGKLSRADTILKRVTGLGMDKPIKENDLGLIRRVRWQMTGIGYRKPDGSMFIRPINTTDIKELSNVAQTSSGPWSFPAIFRRMMNAQNPYEGEDVSLINDSQESP